MAAMRMTITVDEQQYKVHLDRAVDISIPVGFAGQQISVFGAPAPQSRPLQAGGFTGSVAQGGSCNCGVHTFSPHTAGTHTECVGHITNLPVTIDDTLRRMPSDTLVAATLITIEPVAASTTADSYRPALRPTDMVITSGAIAHKLRGRPAAFQRAVVIRTLPNAPQKQFRDYSAMPPAFFSTQAMRDLHALQVEHLLVDLPSLDRLDDDGMLSNHRVFWSMAPGDTSVPEPDISPRTVTELIYVPQHAPDGIYLLDLQVAPLLADAAPSRPVLYPVTAL